MHTSLLTIDKATLLDAGEYTCQVVDWGVQQCKSIYIEIKDETDVKVVPMSATLEKVINYYETYFHLLTKYVSQLKKDFFTIFEALNFGKFETSWLVYIPFVKMQWLLNQTRRNFR